MLDVPVPLTGTEHLTLLELLSGKGSSVIEEPVNLVALVAAQFV